MTQALPSDFRLVPAGGREDVVEVRRIWCLLRGPCGLSGRSGRSFHCPVLLPDSASQYHPRFTESRGAMPSWEASKRPASNRSSCKCKDCSDEGQTVGGVVPFGKNSATPPTTELVLTLACPPPARAWSSCERASVRGKGDRA
jgi:hypothetical protein